MKKLKIKFVQWLLKDQNLGLNINGNNFCAPINGIESAGPYEPLIFNCGDIYLNGAKVSDDTEVILRKKK